MVFTPQRHCHCVTLTLNAFNAFDCIFIGEPTQPTFVKEKKQLMIQLAILLRTPSISHCSWVGSVTAINVPVQHTHTFANRTRTANELGPEDRMGHSPHEKFLPVFTRALAYSSSGPEKETVKSCVVIRQFHLFNCLTAYDGAWSFGPRSSMVGNSEVIQDDQYWNRIWNPKLTLKSEQSGEQWHFVHRQPRPCHCR